MIAPGRIKVCAFDAYGTLMDISSMLAAGLRHAGLDTMLDAVLPAEDVRMFKPAPEVPAPEVYESVAIRFAVEPASVCFVSGDAWDVQGAANVRTLADLPALVMGG